MEELHIEAHVRETRYRPSPIPSGGLEILVLLIFKRNDATNEVFEKMEKFINDFYVVTLQENKKL